MSDELQTVTAPRLEVVPASGGPEGTCPTLKVDGELFHDPLQPYREVLPLEGAEPDVVALFGLGLGYTAAGALHLAPRATVLGWEPLPGMAELAAHALAHEWGIAERVAVEPDLADFQARLLEALAGARSLALVELDALVRREAGLCLRFRQVVDETVDADTIGAPPLPLDAQAWANVARSAPRVAEVPLLGSVAASLADVPAVVVAGQPDRVELDRLAQLAGRALIVTTPEWAGVLGAAGIRPGLVVVNEVEPPQASAGALSASVIAVSPDSHPAWWDASAAAIALFGHTGTAWLFPETDAAHVLGFRHGSALPLASLALSLGARPIALCGLVAGPGAKWNRLDPARRSASAIVRLARAAGTQAIALGKLDPSGPAGDPAARLAATLRARGTALGADAVRAALSGARAAASRVAREHRMYQETGLWHALADFLVRRSDGNAFTRVFLGGGGASSGHAQIGVLLEREQAAPALLDWVEDHLPECAPGDTAFQATPARSTVPPPMRVFIGASGGNDIAARVLAHAIESRSSIPVEIRFFEEEVAARLGAVEGDDGPSPLLVTDLCQGLGRAIYIEPSVLLLEDLARLWELPILEHSLLVPDGGPPSLILVDCERTAAALAANRLFQPQADGIGALPEAWAHCDRATLETAAVRFTCAPWLPWKRDLHPLRWLWEFQFLAALEAGAFSMRDVERAVERRQVRADLAAVARCGRLSLLARPPAPARVAIPVLEPSPA
ncbi:MAG: hypothetical protein KBD01_07775 [Acidobacteria bacterium]|nr:hypothetical protein [Acidobacteriota bacterium]